MQFAYSVYNAAIGSLLCLFSVSIEVSEVNVLSVNSLACRGTILAGETKAEVWSHSNCSRLPELEHPQIQCVNVGERASGPGISYLLLPSDPASPGPSFDPVLARFQCAAQRLGGAASRPMGEARLRFGNITCQFCQLGPKTRIIQSSCVLDVYLEENQEFKRNRDNTGGREMCLKVYCLFFLLLVFICLILGEIFNISIKNIFIFLIGCLNFVVSLLTPPAAPRDGRDEDVPGQVPGPVGGDHQLLRRTVAWPKFPSSRKRSDLLANKTDKSAPASSVRKAGDLTVKPAAGIGKSGDSQAEKVKVDRNPFKLENFVFSLKPYGASEILAFGTDKISETQTFLGTEKNHEYPGTTTVKVAGIGELAGTKRIGSRPDKIGVSEVFAKAYANLPMKDGYAGEGIPGTCCGVERVVQSRAPCRNERVVQSGVPCGVERVVQSGAPCRFERVVQYGVPCGVERVVQSGVTCGLERVLQSGVPCGVVREEELERQRKEDVYMLQHSLLHPPARKRSKSMAKYRTIPTDSSKPALHEKHADLL